MLPVYDFCCNVKSDSVLNFYHLVDVFRVQRGHQGCKDLQGFQGRVFQGPRSVFRENGYTPA